MLRRVLFVSSWARAAIIAAGIVGLGAPAIASTLNQNTSWVIDRSGTSTRYRVVAYGDSIYAGYRGSITNVARRAAPWVDGEYLSTKWAADIEVIRRTKSGALAGDIYNNKIVGERSYMQNSTTRAVHFEMCGNDGLQARSSFKGQTGTCNYGVLNTAQNNCTTYLAAAMQAINTYAHANTKVKTVSNLYYPGWNADNVLASCTDSTTGQRPNMRAAFLPYLARMNWRACNFANQYGFQCVDSFAQWMGADYDSNGDGQVDSVALRYVQGESEAAYVTRISQTLVGTIRDSNTHLVNATTSYDYLLSDDTHGTYYGSATISSGLFGSGSGSGAPNFSNSQIVNGMNPVWNQFGHERMGHGISVFDPATP